MHTIAEKGAARVREGGASGSVKASEESGVVRSKAGRIVEIRLVEVYNATRRIATKMLAASATRGAGGAGGAGVPVLSGV